MTDKLHKGRIRNWSRHECSGGLGYYIRGTFVDHPLFAGDCGHTSWVVARVFDEATGNTEIETRNSCYTLVGAEGVRAA